VNRHSLERAALGLSLTFIAGCELLGQADIGLELDSAAPIVSWYQDWDQDGFGHPDVEQQARFQPVGFVLNSGDCDDTDAAINPLAVDDCDGRDNDCDGQVDWAWCTWEGPVDCIKNDETGRVYGFSDGLELNWVAAQAYCVRELDMYLAVLDDQQEAAWVAWAASSADSGQRWWIGLSGQDGHDWTWVDGSRLDDELAAWASGQPDTETEGADCVELDGTEGDWSTALCSESLAFVCEAWAP
jgi:hypothetical protein